MSGLNKIIVFTPDELKERDKRRDRKIAAKIHQMTVISISRQMIRKTSAQQLNAMRNGCKSLYWSEEKLAKALEYIGDD